MADLRMQLLPIPEPRLSPTQYRVGLVEAGDLTVKTLLPGEPGKQLNIVAYHVVENSAKDPAKFRIGALNPTTPLYVDRVATGRVRSVSLPMPIPIPAGRGVYCQGVGAQANFTLTISAFTSDA